MKEQSNIFEKIEAERINKLLFKILENSNEIKID